ncbi:5'-nucleotidase [Staphylococcus aureus GGMC6024]|nr:two-component system activity regulator YycH [Staphylococcus aureus]EVF27872.1 5'-nucleotidase [Staphylococcus aureus UCIM6050]EVI30998.1 5'-nucleotidase [Staphylococcus aureus GGMC6024]
MNNKEHIKSVILALLVLMSVVLTYMVWNFSPDIANVDNTDSKKSETKPLTTPMTAKMDTTITPFQIIHSKNDHPEGTIATVSNVNKLTKPLKNKEVKSVEHVRRDHNLMIPDLSSDFTLFDFTYDLPLSTYLGQVLNMNAKVPNHFNFNRLVIDHDADDNIVLYAISKDRHDYVKLTTTTKGEEMAKAMNAVGYDAMAVGNHEFDFGYDQLKKLEGMLDFPMLSTNVYKDGKRAFKPSTIVTKNGIRYGIIGVTTPETKTKTRPEGIKGVEFRDPLQSVTAEMMRIYKDVDTFVVISHLGIDPSTQETWRGDYLVKQLSQNPQLKKRITVIDGHSHTVLQNGQIYNNDALAQTGTALANIGKVTFNYRNGEVSNIKPSLINVKDVENVTPNKALAEQINQADQTFRAQTAEVIIPNNTIDFKGERDDVRTRETNLGNAIADAMEAYGVKNFSKKTDFAVTNGGGIRASIAKGKVTRYDLISVLPFGNTIAQIDVKGSDVWTAFEHSLGAPTTQKDGKTVLTANGGLLHISDSIRVYYDMNKPSGKRINAIQILNKETGKFENIDLKRVYHVTMNDFTASGGDGYSMFGGPREEGISLDQVLASYLKTANIAKYDTTEPQRMLLGKPAVSEQPAKGQQGSKGSESGKDVQPIGDDKAMNPAKQPATGKVVLLPTHRGTVSSGTEGSGRTLEGATVSSKSGNQLVRMSVPKGSAHEKQLPKTGTNQSSSPAAMFVLVAGIGLIATVRRRKAS